MAEFSVLKATENYLASKHKLPVIREQHLYPTEASVELDDVDMDGKPIILGGCGRAAFYRYMEMFTGEAYTPYTHWTFAIGKATETVLLDNWRQMGILVDSSVRFFSKEYNVSGEMDAVILDVTDTTKYIICELKSFSGYNATKEILGNKSKKGAPKDSHLLQLLVYLYLNPKVATKGKLVYINKTNGGDNAEFNVSLTKEGSNTYPVVDGIVKRKYSMEMVFERYKKIQSYIDKKELPPRDFNMFWSAKRIEAEYEEGNISKTKYELWQKKKVPVGDWQCSYCRYSSECWGMKNVIETDNEVNID